MAKTETQNSTALSVQVAERARRDLIKRTFAAGATDDEFALFIAVSQRTGLSIEARQLYLVKRWDARAQREVMTIQTSIDGFRLIADRTKKYEGQLGPLWCGVDRIWHDVWVDEEPPVAAKVGVLKTGCREPFWAVARFDEYVQFDRKGERSGMWRKMPANQLAKCAEALSLRKGFPQEMSGVYTNDELPAETPASAPAEEQRPWRTFREMVELFGALKAQLGAEHEDQYYEVLGRWGVDHSNQFRDPQKALAAFDELQAVAANFPPAQSAAPVAGQTT